ncbi:MAG: hypothetical protein ABIK52_01975 [Bacteroidota bacterium]
MRHLRRSTVSQKNFSHDPKPQAFARDATLFSIRPPYPLFKYAGLPTLGYAWAIVPEKDAVALHALLSYDLDLECRWIRVCVLDRIAQQVEYYLLHKIAIHPKLGEVIEAFSTYGGRRKPAFRQQWPNLLHSRHHHLFP